MQIYAAICTREYEYDSMIATNIPHTSICTVYTSWHVYWCSYTMPGSIRNMNHTCRKIQNKSWFVLFARCVLTYQNGNIQRHTRTHNRKRQRKQEKEKREKKRHIHGDRCCHFLYHKLFLLPS